MSLIVIARGPIEHGVQDTQVFGPYHVKQFAYEDAEKINTELSGTDWSAEVLSIVGNTQEHSVGDFIADFIARRKES